MDADKKTATDLQAGFVLGEWQVEPLTNTLRRAGLPTRVEPKVMDVLVCLATHQDRLVTRDELLASVWGGYVVTEEVLTRCISELRTALGDTDRERRFIRTVPKRGYQLIMPLGNGQPVPPPDANDGRDEEYPDAISAPPMPAPATPAPYRPNALERLLNELFSLLRLLINTFGKISLVAIALVFAVFMVGIASDFFVANDGEGLSITISDDEDGVVIKRNGETDGAAANHAADPERLNVAVMPFASLGGDPQLDYFSSGLAEDIRNQLINSPGIRVAARTSSEAFRGQAVDVREIGRQLNVATLLEGTVRVHDERLRLTVQLTDTATGAPLWSERYEESFADVFRVQDQIAGSVVSHLRPSLGAPDIARTPHTRDVRAYELYLLGRHFWNLRSPDAIDQAAAYFEKAIAADENFALAYSGLSDALLLQWPSKDVMNGHDTERMQALIDRAMALNPELAEIHASQGLIYKIQGRLDEAKTAYQHAVELNPNYSMARLWLGNVLGDLGQARAALIEYEKALAVDPLHPSIQFNTLHARLTAGQFAEVERDITRMYEQNRSEHLLKIQLYVYLASGQYDKLLDFAVRHNFSEQYAQYATKYVLHALISLGRDSEASALLDNNPGRLNELDRDWFRGLLALSQRDARALQQASAALIASEVSCQRRDGHRFAAVALSLRGQHREANQAFAAALAQNSQGCGTDLSEEIELLTNYAHSLQQQGRQEEAAATLERARERLRYLREQGNDNPELAFASLALAMEEGNSEAVDKQLALMMERNWNPLARLQQTPFLDDSRKQFLQHTQSQSLAALQNAQSAVQRRSAAIVLTKFGV